MREIIFRGKRLNDGKWIEGSLCTTIPSDENFYTISYFDFEGYYVEEKVIPETIGQYTGLTDKNGKKIFEGDIVKHYCSSADKTVFDVGKIYWRENICQYRRTSRIEGHFYRVNISCEYGVIGNIHDNPELLK